MKICSIAAAKKNLSHLIHQLEFDVPIHLTRYGKPVAVMMSESQYQAMISPPKRLNKAILNWRAQLEENADVGLMEHELNVIRKESNGPDFIWDE